MVPPDHVKQASGRTYDALPIAPYPTLSKIQCEVDLSTCLEWHMTAVNHPTPATGAHVRDKTVTSHTLTGARREKVERASTLAILFPMHCRCNRLSQRPT